MRPSHRLLRRTSCRVRKAQVRPLGKGGASRVWRAFWRIRASAVDRYFHFFRFSPCILYATMAYCCNAVRDWRRARCPPWAFPPSDLGPLRSRERPLSFLGGPWRGVAAGAVPFSVGDRAPSGRDCQFVAQSAEFSDLPQCRPRLFPGRHGSFLIFQEIRRASGLDPGARR